MPKQNRLFFPRKLVHWTLIQHYLLISFAIWPLSYMPRTLGQSVHVNINLINTVNHKKPDPVFPHFVSQESVAVNYTLPATQNLYQASVPTNITEDNPYSASVKDYRSIKPQHNYYNDNEALSDSKPYPKILQDPEEKFLQNVGLIPKGSDKRKKTDVSVSVYHHQAIHDPVINYGKGKPWNLLANGYGLNYGFDLDGKYTRNKGYQFEKAFGREFCKQTNRCVLQNSTTPIQKHIFNVLQMNKVPVKQFFQNEPKDTFELIPSVIEPAKQNGYEDANYYEGALNGLFDPKNSFQLSMYPKTHPNVDQIHNSLEMSKQNFAYENAPLNNTSRPIPQPNVLPSQILFNNNVYYPNWLKSNSVSKPISTIEPSSPQYPTKSTPSLNFVHSNVYPGNNLQNHKWNADSLEDYQSSKSVVSPKFILPKNLNEAQIGRKIPINFVQRQFKFNPRGGNWFAKLRSEYLSNRFH